MRFDLRVAGFTILAQAINHFGDHLPDLAELFGAKAPRGAGGRPQTDTRRQRRLFIIIGDVVLVAGDRGAVERVFGMLALRLLGAEIDEHQVVVGAA